MYRGGDCERCLAEVGFFFKKRKKNRLTFGSKHRDLSVVVMNCLKGNLGDTSEHLDILLN